MAHVKKANRSEPQPIKAHPDKKRYAKPMLRRLGTVRELTQTGATGNPR